MKIVLYKEDGSILYKFEEVKNPAITSDGAEWEGGSVNGTNRFLLLEDIVEVGEVVTDELKAQDKSAQYPKVDLRKENELLKQELAQTNADLMGLMDYVFGGGGA